MKRISVALVDLGERLPIALDDLASQLERRQDAYHFVVETPVPSVGEAHESYRWYHAERLLEILEKHPRNSEYECMIGLTAVPITCMQPDTKDSEKDYFSLGDYRKHAVISMSDNVANHRPSSTSQFQYAACMIMAELLCARASQDLFHTEPKACLFDDCSDRRSVAKVIQEGRICAACRHALEQASVSSAEIDSVQSILKWCKRRTGKESLLWQVARHSLTSLSVGTIIGFWSSIHINSGNYLLATLLFLLLPCAVALFYLYDERKRR